ncbi:MAG: YbgC/FadM family acyl-CoA thioesterase [Pseudomonadota bacterium]
MKIHAFRFFHPLRVRWVEVDMQKIVFNAHYLMYFDTAISDYWRALALPYEEAMHGLGGDLYVRKASVEYHGSARFDDRLDVALRCSRVGNSSILFTGAIFRGDELLITAELVYVFADPATQTSKPVPDALRNILTLFEDGQAMTQLKLGAWKELGTAAAPVRVQVFVEEQGVPLSMEWDEFDADAIHAVCFNGLGTALATGRLIMQVPGVGRIGRMAVKRVLRGSRIGSEILHALIDEARRRGCSEIFLHAQVSARNFYRRSGFTERGEPFEEAGIPHIEMFKSL